MDTLTAFAMGEANRGNPSMVFDWAKAARLIREQSFAGPVDASAGLKGDWEYTGGAIFRNGSVIPRGQTYTYLASTWAVPELDINGEVYECYVREDKTEWGSDTYWPAEALKILSGDG